MVVDERDAPPLVLELREVAPATLLALLLGRRHPRHRRHRDPYGTLKMGPSWGGGPSEEEQLGHRAFLRSKG
jgi:hypothetical protein